MAATDPAGRPEHHLSAPLLASGRARFIRDEPAPAGMLHASVLTGSVPRGRIRRLDTGPAAAVRGVFAVLTAQDIPGQNQIGEIVPDEPLLAQDEVVYVGQPVALVVADSAALARRAAGMIEVEYEALEPVLTLEQAMATGSLLAPERVIERGDLAAGFERAEHRLEGETRVPGQEHVYLETQCARAIPSEDEEIIIHSATQSPAGVQHTAARVLGLDAKDITVDVRRLGGAFGGKESSATPWACLAALGCLKTGRPVEVGLSRSEDMAWTGKRHPFLVRYRVGFTGEGRITACEFELNQDGGACADLSTAILERAMLHADACYSMPAVRITGRPFRTNTPPNTAMRGFGAPQAIAATETVLHRIARHLGRDPYRVRLLNSYRPGEPAPYGQPVEEACFRELMPELRQLADYDDRLRGVEDFNLNHRFRKQGLALVPIRFGISFTASFKNQASALVWVYQDGTVSVSHGGIEMGQGVNTKVAQVVAGRLGVNLDRVRVESSNTRRIGNASPTAASTGADLNGNAALVATSRVAARLRVLAARLLADRHGTSGVPQAVRFHNNSVYDESKPGAVMAFAELAHEAHRARVSLGAHGFYRTPGIGFDRESGRGRPFYYHVFGCCLAVAEVDLLTGRSAVRYAHILHQTGRSLNPAIDRGQIAGGFIQGLGWLTTEELRVADGRYLTDDLSTYKIPTIRDLPGELAISTDSRPRKAASVLGSKAVGEPPFLYGLAGWFAIKDAVESIAGRTADVELAMPATPEAVLAAVERLGREAH